MLLPITLTTAGGAGLIDLWLAFRCVQLRQGAQLMQGDGGNQTLARRMRAQANFTEYAPLVLILLGLVEYARGPATWLWVTGIAFLVARLLHPFGLERPAPNPLRMIGAFATWAVLLVLALYALYLPYTVAAAPAAGAVASAPAG